MFFAKSAVWKDDKHTSGLLFFVCLFKCWRQKFLSEQKFRGFLHSRFSNPNRNCDDPVGKTVASASLTVQHFRTCVSFLFPVIELLCAEVPTASQGELLMGNHCNSCFSPPQHPSVDICCRQFIFFNLFFTSQPTRIPKLLNNKWVQPLFFR